MKKTPIIVLLLIICAVSCAPNRNDYKWDYRISPRMECYFQVLLKRWYDGADGQGQGPVGDSRVLGLVERHKNTGTTPSEILKVYENLLQYPGLGDNNLIFVKLNFNILVIFVGSKGAFGRKPGYEDITVLIAKKVTNCKDKPDQSYDINASTII
ncbi:MAG: hypothetical protein LBU83_06565 [Bacteroidales bacterium]|jgi:hypothetical protein|nr:hypothetical protein [Bacteroidales bacterium]